MKTITSRMMPLILAVILIGCGGNSIERDAKRVADLYCEARELAQNAANGDLASIEESTKLTQRAEALQRELEGKYSSAEESQKFAEILSRKMRRCH